MKHEKNGTVYVFLAAVLFSIGGICIKMIPWNPIAINGARNLISVIILSVYLKRIHHKIVINPAVIFGAICLTGTTTLFTMANKMTTAANTIVLQYTAPIFVIFMMWLFLKKRPVKRDMIACIFVLIGIVCFFIDGLSTGNTAGDILAIISGVCYAGVFMLNSFENSDSLSSIVIGQGISAVTSVWFVFGETNFSSTAIIGILLLGIFQLGLAYIFMAKGLESTNAVTASLTSAIEPILNPAIVALILHETIAPLAFVGAVIVIASIIIYNLGQALSAN